MSPHGLEDHISGEMFGARVVVQKVCITIRRSFGGVISQGLPSYSKIGSDNKRLGLIASTGEDIDITSVDVTFFACASHKDRDMKRPTKYQNKYHEEI